MNERIKQLAIEAGFRSDVTVSDGNGNHMPSKVEEKLKKFSELIVQECSKLIAERDARVEPAPHIFLLKEFGL